MEFGIEFDMLEFSKKFGTKFDIEFDKLEIGIECGKLSSFVHNGFPYIESSSLVPVLFREVFSHPFISFFHLLVNGFSVTCFCIFLANCYRVIH